MTQNHESDFGKFSYDNFFIGYPPLQAHNISKPNTLSLMMNRIMIPSIFTRKDHTRIKTYLVETGVDTENPISLVDTRVDTETHTKETVVDTETHMNLVEPGVRIKTEPHMNLVEPGIRINTESHMNMVESGVDQKKTSTNLKYSKLRLVFKNLKEKPFLYVRGIKSKTGKFFDGCKIKSKTGKFFGGCKIKSKKSIILALFTVLALISISLLQFKNRSSVDSPVVDMFGENTMGVETVKAPRVYIYEDPAVDWSYLLDCYEEQNGISILMDERQEHAQNSGEIWMHKAAQIYENRVYDPREADLFYMPIYLALSSNMDFRAGSLTCQGLTHTERVKKSLDFITKSEHYILRGGSDHILTCTWFWCGPALGNRGRVLFQRTIIGINEYNNEWARWECLNKIVTVPYTGSSILSKPENSIRAGITEIPREIPFYFSGSSRDRPDRLNLRIVNDVLPGSRIQVSDNWFTWSETPEQFAESIHNSKFCFIPRGDTLSSRRLFDAISAGCIPVLTTVQTEGGMVPFADELDYNEFCILVDESTFLDKGLITSLVFELDEMEETKYLELRKGLNVAREHLIYGTTGDSFVPNVKVFESYIREIESKSDKGYWHCDPTPFYKDHAIRVDTELFPPNPTNESIVHWVSDKEAMVNREHKILMCSPPFTNSERPVKEFMNGLQAHEDSTWPGDYNSDNDGADFLKVEDFSFYDIFEGVEWLKVIFHRDPVLRILDAFTSTVSQDPDEFQDFVESLHKKHKLEDLSLGDYRSISSHCGFKYSHYPTSLRADVWDMNSLFLERLPAPMNSLKDSMNLYEFDNTRAKLESCEWDSFYDTDTLKRVYELYDDDYISFGISKDWDSILKNCKKNRIQSW